MKINMKSMFGKRIYGVVWTFTLISKLSYGQNPSYPNVSPIEPLNQYLPTSQTGNTGGTDVDLSTGSMQFSLPLTICNGRQINSSVNLGYKGGSGIKVNERASNVGLGFSLDAGGYIRRIVRGIKDEKEDFSTDLASYNAWIAIREFPSDQPYEAGWLDKIDYEGQHIDANGTPTPATYNLSDLRVGGLVKEFKNQHANFAQSIQNPPGLLEDTPFGNFQWEYFWKIFHGAVDGEPDLFQFKFGNYIGSFVFNEEGIPVLTPYQDIKIIPALGPQGGNHEKWIFITPDGIKYIFNNNDTYRESTIEVSFTGLNDDPTTAYFNESQSEKQYISTWYLSRIESTSGEQIDLSYSYAGDIVNTTISHIRQDKITSDASTNSIYYLDADSFSNGSRHIETSVIQTIVSPKFLLQISSTYGHIDFIVSNLIREDMPNNYPLKYIRQYNSNNILKKEYEFTYDYFLSNLSCNDFNCKRLKLLNIKQNPVLVSGSNIPVPAALEYTFDYNSTTNLPELNSTAIDFWGFYNGVTNNIDLIPEMTIYNPITQTNETFTGANREPNEVYMQANILNKITFPGGGSKSFEYELNNYFELNELTPIDLNDGTNMNHGGLRVKNTIVNDAVNSQNNIITTYKYEQESDPLRSSGTIGYKRNMFDIQNSGDFYNSITSHDYYYVPFYGGTYLRTLYLLRSSYPTRTESSDLIRYSRVIKGQPSNGNVVFEFTNFSSNPDLRTIGEKYLHNSNLSPNSSIEDCWLGPYYSDKDNDAGAPGADFSCERGLLKRMKIFDQGGNILSETINDYQFNHQPLLNSPEYLYALRARPDMDFFNGNIYGLNFPYTPNNTGIMNIEFYKICSSWTELIKTTLITYNSAGLSTPITKITEYEFDQNNHHQLKRIKSTNSKGQIQYSNFKYAADYDLFNCFLGGTTAFTIKQMNEKHIINKPIEIYGTYLESNIEYVTSGSLITFKELANGDIKPFQVFSLKLSEPAELNLFILSHTLCPTNLNDGFEFDTHYELENTFRLYDYNSRLVTQTDKNNVSYSDVWNDEHLSPIASFTNAIHSVDPSLGNECGYEGFERSAMVGYSSFSFDYMGGYSSEKCNRVFANSNPNPGEYSYSKGFEFLPNDQDQKYILSAFVKTGVGFNNNAGALVIEINDALTGSSISYADKIFSFKTDWQYIEVSIDLSTITQQAKLKCYAVNYDDANYLDIDEIRFRPLYSQSSSIIYDPVFEKAKTKFDQNSIKSGIIEYDGFGREIWVMDKDDKVQSYIEYHKMTGISDLNYSKIYSFRVPFSKQDANAAVLNNTYSPNEINLVTIFADGLERPIQSVGKALSPQLHDIVSFNVFDNIGRSPIDYLPYCDIYSNDGTYKSNPVSDQLNYYNGVWSPVGVAQDGYPFNIKIFDNSPLNKIVEQGCVGQAWQPFNNHSVKSSNKANDENEVRLWNINTTGVSSPGYYSEGQLYKLITFDEENHKSHTFYDKNGNLICVKSEVLTGLDINNKPVTFDYTNGTESNLPNVNLNTTLYTTSYIYDKMNRLIYVIPPAATNSLESNSITNIQESDLIFMNFMFSNKYDIKGRVVMSKTPGADWKYMVYNKQNKPILSQSGKQALTGEWDFIKYDRLGRIAGSGKYLNNSTSSILQNLADDPSSILWENQIENGISINDNYTNNAFPVLNIGNGDEYFVTNLYDNYLFDLKGRSFLNNNNPNNPITGQLFGYNTGQVIKILESNPPAYLTNISYFDDKGRIIQSHLEHQLAGWDVVDVEYNFTNSITQTFRSHSSGIGTVNLNIKNRFEYDHAGRLLKTFQTTGDVDPELEMSNYQYNESGQIIKRNLHKDFNGDYLQKIDFRYNIRGWLRKINNSELEADGFDNNDDDDAFGQEIIYNDYNSLYATGNNQGSGLIPISKFNGLISAVKWKSKAPSIPGSSKPEHAYVFRYDDIGKMTAAYYANNGGGSLIFDMDTNYYKEKMSYDIGGNIKNLERKSGQGIIDNLAYSYINDANVLESIEDIAGFQEINDFHDSGINSTDYVYDENGNMISDANKDVSIDYNYLNKPKIISNNTTNESVTFIYTALGQKIGMVHGTSNKQYVNGIEYTDGVLSFVTTREGRVRAKQQYSVNPEEYVYDYFLKDYLGNVRVVITNEEIKKHYIATMEDQNDASEQQIFLNVPETRDDRPVNAPPDSTYTPDYRVSGLDDGTPIGHAKVLKMNEGDKVDIDAKYYYHIEETANNNVNINVQALLNQLGNIFFINNPYLFIPGDAAINAASTFSNNSGVTGFLNGILGAPDTLAGQNIPRAYLIYLYFNEKFVFKPNASGILRAETPDVLGDLAIINLEAPENGYLYVYVNNESESRVSFDNLQIIHYPSCIMEMNDYYPYGMLNTGISAKNINGVDNDYKYCDKELLSELDLYQEDFGWRQYDPASCRWSVQDPAMQFFNPYVSMAGNPVSFVDPNGAITRPSKPGDVSNMGDSPGLDFSWGGGGGSGTINWATMHHDDKIQFLNNNHMATITYFDENGHLQMAVGGSLVETEEGTQFVQTSDGRYVYSSNTSEHPIINGYLASWVSTVHIEPFVPDFGESPSSTGNIYVDVFELVAQGNGGNLALGSLLSHYMGGSGDNYNINQSSFNGLISELSQNNALNFKNSAPAPGVKGLYQIQISTYGTSYKNAAGYATLYFNTSGIVGYSDWWNFEPHAGDRDWWSETKTTMGSAIPGTPFWVLYGTTPPTNLIPKH